MHYRSLIGQGLWPPATEGNSKTTEIDIEGLRAEIRKLTQTVGGSTEKGKIKPYTPNTDQNRHKNITCFACGKKGHMASSCPQNQGGASHTGSEQGSGGNAPQRKKKSGYSPLQKKGNLTP